MGAFAAIAQTLRDGADVDVVVGDTSATAAFDVAREWLAAGIELGDIVGWLRSGCWKPTAARAMAGLSPWRLLDDDGRPLHFLDVGTADGQPLPLARAVAEDFVAAAVAPALAYRRAPRPGAADHG